MLMKLLQHELEERLIDYRSVSFSDDSYFSTTPPEAFMFAKLLARPLWD